MSGKEFCQDPEQKRAKAKLQSYKAKSQEVVDPHQKF